MNSSNTSPSDIIRLGHNWYSWDWPLLYRVVRPILCDVTRLRLDQLFVGLAICVSVWMKHSGTASGGWEVWELWLAITWSKFGVRENLKLQNHSNNYGFENALKIDVFPNIRSKDNYERVCTTKRSGHYFYCEKACKLTTLRPQRRWHLVQQNSDGKLFLRISVH